MALEFLGDAVSAIVSGGATGILGSAISVFAKYKLQKLQNDFELAKISAETEQIRMESERQIAVANIEAKVKEDQSADDLMEASYSTDKATYATGEEARNSKLFIFLDFFRGMIRPSATTYLVGLSTWITLKAFNILNGLQNAITPDQALALVQQAVLIILYLTATAVLWWFGTRNKLIMPVR